MKVESPKAPNGAFRHKRFIHGYKVMVKSEPDGNGITRETYLVRFIKDGIKTDVYMEGFYFWQAFNQATKMIQQGAV